MRLCPEFLPDESRHVFSCSLSEYVAWFPVACEEKRLPSKDEVLQALPLAALPSWWVAKRLMEP